MSYLRRHKDRKYGKTQQVQIPAGNYRKNPGTFPTLTIVQDKNKIPVFTKKPTKIFTELFYRETLPDAKFDNVFSCFMITPRGLKDVSRI